MYFIIIYHIFALMSTHLMGFGKELCKMMTVWADKALFLLHLYPAKTDNTAARCVTLPFIIYYLWYSSFALILNALYTCSVKMSLISWCGKVIFENPSFKLLKDFISSQIPSEPPIIKSIVL